MIPIKHAETVDQALDILAQKNPSAELKAAIDRLKRVVSTYAGDEGAFVPVDFTESDLNEATRVFEAAARKEVTGYAGATVVAQRTFREAMNKAEGQQGRIKCRTTLIVELVVSVAKKLT